MNVGWPGRTRKHLPPRVAVERDRRSTTCESPDREGQSIARALLNDPDLIFLDEPTTGLDPQARHLIWDRLKRLTAQGYDIAKVRVTLQSQEPAAP